MFGGTGESIGGIGRSSHQRIEGGNSVLR